MSNLFLDSNICVYAFDRSDVTKQDKALSLLRGRPWISSQVIIETHLACSRKLKLPLPVCDENSLILADITSVFSIDAKTIHLAIHFKKKYSFSFLDSIIVASAFQADCDTIISEDLQRNQLIEGRLKVVNPF